MTVYELTHLFFRSGGEPVYSPKGLGLFASTESAEEAVRYYKTQPGFRDAPDAFSVRRRPVYGTENTALVHARGIIAEEIVNRCPVGRRNWAEGFTVSG